MKTMLEYMIDNGACVVTSSADLESKITELLNRLEESDEAD